MTTLVSNIKLVYPGHPKNGESISILVKDGVIQELEPAKSVKAKHEINGKGLLLFPGMVDAQCQSGEPGHEDKEDFATLMKAAKVGGFTDLILLPSNDPISDSRSEIRYIQEASEGDVTLHAFGAITKELKGAELSEMFDMHKAGAVAFTDGKRPIDDVNMMKRALDYARNFDGIICSYPYDQRIAPGGMVNESKETMLLGLKQTPGLAEELMLNRDLYLLEYTGSRLHVATISTKGSLELVKKHKGSGKLTSGVAMSNLLYSEEALQSFDTNFKLEPALRSEKDRKALIKGVASGVIDVIVSDHHPETIENKDVEFDQAVSGMTMLETMLSLYQMHLSSEISMDRWVEATALNPRKIFGLELPTLEKGELFDFTVFDPKAKWEYASSTKVSKAANSPVLGTTLTGKVIHLS